MTRTRMALTLTTLGLAGLLSLTGCGSGSVSDEAFALESAGLEQPAPGASAGPGKGAAARKLLRKNTLHGEVTVQGKDGVRTIVVQRGTVTAVDATTLGVKSADGFVLTWTLGDKLKVVQDKKKVDASAVKAGAQVGVAGAKDGENTTARLIRIG